MAGAATITVRYNADPSISASASVTTVNATVDEVLISEDEFDMYISPSPGRWPTPPET